MDEGKEHIDSFVLAYGYSYINFSYKLCKLWTLSQIYSNKNNAAISGGYVHVANCVNVVFVKTQSIISPYRLQWVSKSVSTWKRANITLKGYLLSHAIVPPGYHIINVVHDIAACHYVL